MNRLYAVENRFTMTGGMADHRFRCAASQIPAFAVQLAKKIAASTNDRVLGGVVGDSRILDRSLTTRGSRNARTIWSLKKGAASFWRAIDFLPGCTVWSWR